MASLKQLNQFFKASASPFFIADKFGDFNRLSSEEHSYLLAQLYAGNHLWLQPNKIYYYRFRNNGGDLTLSFVSPSVIQSLQAVPGVDLECEHGEKIFKTTLRELKKAFNQHSHHFPSLN